MLGPSRFASLWWEHKQQRAHVYAGAAADCSGRSVVASNGLLHDAVLPLIRDTPLVPPY